MIAGFTFLLAKIAMAIGWIGDLFVAVFKAIWDLIKDFASWVLEQFMTLATTVIAALELDWIQSATSAMGAVPQQLADILIVLGIPLAFSIIVAAIGVRLVLQLIPFTRLGS